MTSQIRTKPWEVSQGKSAASTVPVPESTVPSMSSSTTTAPANSATPSTTSAAAAAATSSSIAPNIPERPTNLISDFNTASDSPYGGYSANRGGYGYGGGYGSSMLGGGYGSSMYGGYGSSMYGGGYGSSMYGGGYGGYGGYGSSFGGMYPSIGAGLYQVIDAINMIDQTFFALSNVAEQFRHMGNVVTSLLGIYALKDFLKKILRKILGIKTKFSLQEFQKFQSLDNKNTNKSRFRIWPILVFVGLPLLISKLISGLQKQHQEQQLAQQTQQQQQLTQSPASVQFAKALYEFTPENTQIEIPLEVGEIVAILEDKSGWSRIRKRKGEMGWVPTNYLELIERNANV